MKKAIFLSCLVLLLSSCGAFTLEKSKVMNNADMTSYSTFMMEPIDESNIPVKFSASDLQNIVDAVSDQLISRGYKQVKSNADMLVYLALSAQPFLETNVDQNSATLIGGYRYHYFGRGPRGFGGTVYNGPMEITTEVKNEGFLMMDIVDTKTNQHAFYSEISSEADGTKYKDMTKLQEAAETLFSKFPVPVKQ